MVEFDRKLAPISLLVNKCYTSLFPFFPAFPEFSFSRLMATIWRVKVFNKMKDELFDAFKIVLHKEREDQMANRKRYSNEEKEEMMDCFDTLGNTNLLAKFLQTIADISINEITIHMLGSTKFIPADPYLKLQDEILTSTK